MAPLKEQIDNHWPKIAKWLAWWAVKWATVGWLLFALNPLAWAVGAGVYYAKSMYNSYQENPNDEIHFRHWILWNRTNNNTNTTRRSLLWNLLEGGNNITNNRNNDLETCLNGELNDIEAFVNMRESNRRPPNMPSQIILAQITANLAQQEHRLIGDTPHATWGNLWNRVIWNRIRNRRAERSILERLNNIEDTQEQIRIMWRLTAIQNTMNTIRGRLWTPPPAINVWWNNMTRIPHTIWTPVSIDLRTARTDIHGNPILPLPAGVTITNITITENTTWAAIMPHTPFDATTQSFQLNPTTPWEHNYTITYTDSLGRISPTLNFIVESQNNLAWVPLQPTINWLDTTTNTVSYTTAPQQIHGTTSPNTTVELVDHADHVIAHTTSWASGAYRIDTTIANGLHQNLRIRALNWATQQQNNSGFFNIDINVTVPITATTILAPSFQSRDLDQQTQYISGNTTAWMQVEIFDNSNPPRLLQRGTSDTNWNYDIPLNLTSGTHDLTITVSDSTNTTNTPQSRNESITVTYNAPTNTPNTITIQQPTITDMWNTFRLSSTSNIPANTEIRMIKAGPTPTVLWRTITNTSWQIQIDFTNDRRNQSITRRDIGLQYTDQNWNIHTEWFTIDIS